MTIWFATGNAHKRAELAAIFPGYTIKIPAEAGIPFDPDETGASFAENALIKARELRRLIGAAGFRDPVMADDSGLCVDALGGRPGIRSARYGGDGGRTLGDRDRNALLLRELGDASDRGARFVCAMALFLSDDRFFLAQETLEGELIAAERGEGGFGYDPILFIPSLGRTVAELSAEEKNRISHRGKAGRALAALLDAALNLQ
jgi:XTP/dITP diphosphohydrolase